MSSLIVRLERGVILVPAAVAVPARQVQQSAGRAAMRARAPFAQVRQYPACARRGEDTAHKGVVVTIHPQNCRAQPCEQNLRCDLRTSGRPHFAQNFLRGGRYFLLRKRSAACSRSFSARKVATSSLSSSQLGALIFAPPLC